MAWLGVILGLSVIAITIHIIKTEYKYMTIEEVLANIFLIALMIFMILLCALSDSVVILI